uniref:Uncharacterized protein n=1 Tax=Rhipicephalus zambeziensis TaxID=60191 RepID=A0A224Y5J0_9ACAR
MQSHALNYPRHLKTKMFIKRIQSKVLGIKLECFSSRKTLTQSPALVVVPILRAFSSRKGSSKLPQIPRRRHSILPDRLTALQQSNNTILHSRTEWKHSYSHWSTRSLTDFFSS